MMRLRAGVLPVPSTIQRRDHHLAALATPPACPACSQAVRADEIHMLVDCTAVDAQRDIMWQAITHAVRAHERVDWLALLMASPMIRIDLLLLSGPFPAVEGKPVEHREARSIIRAVLKQVHDLWRAFDAAVKELPRSPSPEGCEPCHTPEAASYDRA
jgi:uncharacterized protein YciI